MDILIRYVLLVMNIYNDNKDKKDGLGAVLLLLTGKETVFYCLFKTPSKVMFETYGSNI